jgi:predicted nucleotidyltransferase
MKTTISNELKKLENEYSIEILYACESGSRAWGFSSIDSDYDVRFIYKHNLNWYLTVNTQKDIIEKPITNLLDIGGWDIKKTLTLLKKSNAVVWEWLQSPIVYENKNNFKDEIWKVSKEYYSLKSACYNYLALGKNILKQIENENKIKLKKYFYILRSILSAKWICEKNQIPPMEFYKLLKIIENKDLLAIISKMLDIKSTVDESYLFERKNVLDNFIDYEFNKCDNIVSSLPSNKTDVKNLNEFYRKIIKG